MRSLLSRSLALGVLCLACSVLSCRGNEQEESSDTIEKTYIKIDAAVASSVFPSVGSNGMREYSPDKALTKGSGYWSSEGNHKTEVVSWTGTLNSRRTVEAIEINWAYAPGKVSIAASFDGKEPFQEIVPFQDVNAPSAAFEELIKFPHPVRAKAIRILMQNARYEYFGINLVQLVGAGNPIFRLQSGITSPHQDMCLQIDEHDDVVLDGCLSSLTAMDGRALWKYNELGQLYNPIKNKCMVLKDNIDLDGGAVIAENCEQAYKYNDGRSVWELQPNNQLKLLKGGSFCLSQQGSKAGMSDVAKNKQAKASHPRPGDSSHGPAVAVDGHSETYWASQGFPLEAVPDAVFLDIDLGEKYKLNTAAIDWEYPAMSYSISISDDGRTFTPVAHTAANNLFTTLNDLKSSVGRYVRLILEKPHPVHGKVDEEMLYGIRQFAIYSNRLRSIVQPCGTAKNSADARDKYFLELVAEVDFTSGNELHNAIEAVNRASAQISQQESELEGIMPALTTCKADKESTKQRLVTLEAKYSSLSDQLANLDNSLRAASALFAPSRVSSLSPGHSEESPVEDCYTLKNTTPQAVSGFYFVTPACSPKVLRAYCDSEYGGTYFVPPENDGIVEPLDTVKACAAYGLEPVQLHSVNQIASLHRMLKQMELDLTNPVPLGVNNGSGFFYSLDLQKDITNLVLGASPTETGVQNTVGIGSEGLVFFDSSQVEMAAIICSTNKDALNPPPAYIDVSCSTTPGGNAAFDGPPGTSVAVKCPQNCLFTAEGAQVIGGEGGVYSDDSSICLAAVHGGFLDRSGLVSVRMVQAPSEFEGSDNNGVMSESYMGAPQSRAFRLERVAVKCPKTAPPAASSFLEVNVVRDTASLSNSEAASNPKPDGAVLESDQFTNPATEAAVHQLEVMVNSRIGSTSPSVLHAIEEEASKVISNARSILKPAGVLEAELRARASQLLSKATVLTDSLKSAAGRVTSTLDRTNQQLQQALLARASQTQADSWELAAFNPAEFYDVFEVYNSRTAIGAGNWRVGGSPAGGRGGRNILSQAAVVSPSHPGAAAVGTFVRLRHKRFFDSIFSADVYVSGTGSVGVAFRMKDFSNMFLFEMRQSGGFKRLLRIVDGTPVVVARVDDGGYLEGKWYTIRIETREARLRISVIEESGKLLAVQPEPIIDLVDGSFMSGSIGFFTSEVDGAFFDMVRVEALPCVLKTVSLPPKPATCSNYRESFMEGFHKNWVVSDSDSAGGPSRWEYRTNIAGEPKVIAQLSSVHGLEEHTPSVAVLGGNRACESGTFSFKVLPQCDSGIVGAVFKYKDAHNYMLFEMGPSFARLRKRVDGSFSTSAKSFLGGYKVGQWNQVTITFSGGNAIVNAGRGISPLPIFSVLGVEKWEGGTVGLASWNCGGVAFADIALHPVQESAMLPSPVRPGAPSFSEVEENSDAGMEVCLKRRDALARRDFCEALRSKNEGTYEKCRTNFCDVCCDEELPVSAKARNTCKRQCHADDHQSVATLEALEAAQTGCAIDASKPIYRVCDGEKDPIRCHEEVCEMCCETAKVPSGQPHRARKFVVNECKKICAVPIAQQEM